MAQVAEPRSCYPVRGESRVRLDFQTRRRKEPSRNPVEGDPRKDILWQTHGLEWDGSSADAGVRREEVNLCSHGQRSTQQKAACPRGQSISPQNGGSGLRQAEACGSCPNPEDSDFDQGPLSGFGAKEQGFHSAVCLKSMFAASVAVHPGARNSVASRQRVPHYSGSSNNAGLGEVGGAGVGGWLGVPVAFTVENPHIPLHTWTPK